MPVTRGQTGAASELTACAYLLRQGYHTFRSESPSCPFDVGAYRDGQWTRVEVKSVNWSPANRAKGRGPSVAWPRNDEWDLLIVVDPPTGRCIEITTHDKRAGVDQLRAAWGFDPPLNAMKS